MAYPGLRAVDEFLTSNMAGDEHYVLREGDAITFPSRLPHWNMNHGDAAAVVLFCVTPPSF